MKDEYPYMLLGVGGTKMTQTQSLPIRPCWRAETRDADEMTGNLHMVKYTRLEKHRVLLSTERGF